MSPRHPARAGPGAFPARRAWRGARAGPEQEAGRAGQLAEQKEHVREGSTVTEGTARVTERNEVSNRNSSLRPWPGLLWAPLRPRTGPHRPCGSSGFPGPPKTTRHTPRAAQPRRSAPRVRSCLPPPPTPATCHASRCRGGASGKADGRMRALVGGTGEACGGASRLPPRARSAPDAQGAQTTRGFGRLNAKWESVGEKLTEALSVARAHVVRWRVTGARCAGRRAASWGGEADERVLWSLGGGEHPKHTAGSTECGEAARRGDGGRLAGGELCAQGTARAGGCWGDSCGCAHAPGVQAEAGFPQEHGLCANAWFGRWAREARAREQPRRRRGQAPGY